MRVNERRRLHIAVGVAGCLFMFRRCAMLAVLFGTGCAFMRYGNKSFFWAYRTSQMQDCATQIDSSNISGVPSSAGFLVHNISRLQLYLHGPTCLGQSMWPALTAPSWHCSASTLSSDLETLPSAALIRQHMPLIVMIRSLPAGASCRLRSLASSPCACRIQWAPPVTGSTTDSAVRKPANIAAALTYHMHSSAVLQSSVT